MAFSVVAFFSSVVLYCASPRFEESPLLFGTAALALFALEVSVFEVAIRQLPFPLAKSKAARFQPSPKPDKLSRAASSNPGVRDDSHDAPALQNPLFRK